MLPNKIAATVLVGVLVLEVLALGATAQTPIVGPDLIVEDVDIGRPRVSGLPGFINITIRNQGSTDFTSTTGWQIFVGLNGATDAECIEKGDGVAAGGGVGSGPATLAPCYIRMTPTTPANADGTNAPNVPRGEARKYRLTWNASHEDAGENQRIYVVIGSLGSTPDDTPGDEQCGPDPSPNCANNIFALSGVNIGRLGVRAVPQREVSSAANANVNSAWKESEITESCPVDPAVVSRGCKVKAGKTIVASYLVTNTGTVDDSYTASFPTGMAYYLERGYVFAFAPQTFTLARSQAREVKLSIVVPENETAGNKTNVEFNTQFIRWTSTRNPAVATNTLANPSCDAPDVAPQCVDPSWPSFVIDFRRGLNATSNETWRQVSVGKAALMNITLNNTGNADDTFNITILREGQTINDSWSPTVGGAGVTLLEGTQTTGFQLVKKGELKNVTLQVTAPSNATNATYTFDVLMKSVGDTDGTARCKANEVPAEGQCRLRFTIHLAQDWRISPIPGADTRVVPGEPVTYTLGIYNAGNGYDNVTLDLQTTVFGWNAQLSDRVARLTPFNTTYFTLSVTSPPNIAENTVGAFFVNATSSGPIETPLEARSKASLKSQMTIIRGPNMRLDLPVNSSFVDAGATASYTLRVTNVGNVADNFTLPTPERPSDWGIDVTPAYLELQPNQQGEVTVDLRAPNSAMVGEKATAIVKVQSTVERTREKTVSLEGRVSGPDFFVDSVLVNSTTPYTGDPLEVGVVLGNGGNKGTDKNLTLRVYFVQNGVERVIGEKVYPPLAIPGQRRLVENFAWDTAGVEGAGVLLARIDVDGTIPEIDDSASSNEKTKPLTLRTFDIKLTPAQGLSARPGEKLVYGEVPNAFVVQYDGNQLSETVTIRFESEHGWLTDSEGAYVDSLESQIALPRGSPLPLLATLDVPTIPGTGKDVLTLTVIPTLRPDQTLRATTTTTILDEENPKVTRITVSPTSAKLGDPIQVVAELEDATGISAVTAYVVLPTNETQSIVLTQGADGKWNGTKAFTVAGSYRVSAEAADAADPPNINRTRLTTATFSLTPGSAPTIKLAAGQGTTIRTGSPIKLDIRDPLGIGDVTYAIKGVTYEVRGPGYQIDTSAFAAGPVDIFVTAENIYGVATTQKLSFTVDNAPPQTPTIKLTPEEPRAGEQVTLAIKTESKVEAVDVLIKRDGQVVQTLNATRKSVGNFEARFDTPEGDYRIDVTARDAAGNTRLEESAVVFSAKPGSPIPGPGLWMALLGLAGLALVMRRR